MITFPCAKINLGLNIVSKRPDGYHNLETVFYPIPLTDALEIKYMDEKFPSESPCDLKITGNETCRLYQFPLFAAGFPNAKKEERKHLLPLFFIMDSFALTAYSARASGR